MFILQGGKLGFREFMLGGIVGVHKKVKSSSSECKTSVFVFFLSFVFYLFIFFATAPTWFLSREKIQSMF